jgi:hypothetical protein
MDDLSRFCCQSIDCPDYGKRGAGNLTVCGHFGKAGRICLLYCRTCHSRFSERKGTPFFGARLSDEKVLSVLQHIQEGCGVRKTGRLVGVNTGTVSRPAGVPPAPTACLWPIRRKRTMMGKLSRPSIPWMRRFSTRRPAVCRRR